jgi:hypothetical protein
MNRIKIVRGLIRIFGVLACVMAAHTGIAHHLQPMATAAFATAVLVLPLIWADLYGKVRRYSIQATYPDGSPYIDDLDKAFGRTGPSTGAAYGEDDCDARVAAIEAAGLTAHVFRDPYA